MKLLATVLAALSVIAAASPALAADPRVRSVPFEPDTVFQFVGQPGYQSAIRFGPDESIENVAVGDSVAWQVTPNKRGDHLFIKPMLAGARSNMTVVTTKRTYLFDLRAPRGAQPVYALSFEYPAYPAPGAVQPPPVSEPAVAMAVVAPQPVPAPILNFGWVPKGDKTLLPARTFDDGKAVYLSWPEGSPLPAVLVAASDGAEGPINYRVDKGYIVVDGIPRELILRRGKHRATVTAPKPPKTFRTAATETRRGSR